MRESASRSLTTFLSHLPRPAVMLALVAALYACHLDRLIAAQQVDDDARVCATAWRPSRFCSFGEGTGVRMNGVAIGDSIQVVRRRIASSTRRWTYLRRTLHWRLEHVFVRDVETGTEMELIVTDDRVTTIEAGRRCTVEMDGHELFRQGTPFRDVAGAFRDEGHGMLSLRFGPQVRLNVSAHDGVVTTITMSATPQSP